MEQKDLMEWERLTISNDFMFSAVMKDKDICKKTLEILLNKKIGKIEYVDSQKIIDISYVSKGVRLDVYVEDENGIYNIEMQVVDKGDLPKRSRFYSSMMDLHTLGKGKSYKVLKGNIVIFICRFDPFNLNFPHYDFDLTCRQDRSLCLNDGLERIFFNTQDYFREKEEDIKEFLEYIETGRTNNNSFIEELENRIRSIKSSEKWRVNYMKLLERDQENYDKGLLDGIEKGKEEGILEGIEKGINNLIEVLREANMEEEFIINALIKKYNLTEEQIKEYLKRE